MGSASPVIFDSLTNASPDTKIISQGKLVLGYTSMKSPGTKEEL